MTKISKNTLKVHHIRHLTPSTYVLRFDRNERNFTAGQHVILGIAGEKSAREYSVYSSESDDFFEILVKAVKPGDVSQKLKKLHPGDLVSVEGPMGFFTIEPQIITHGKVALIATGTGIAPYHSYVRSYPQLDYKIIHGVRYASEAYDYQDYDPSRFVLCTSGENAGNFHGRVTDYLRENEIDTTADYYLCGNVKMIHEAFDILKEKGVNHAKIHAEVYF